MDIPAGVRAADGRKDGAVVAGAGAAAAAGATGAAGASGVPVAADDSGRVVELRDLDLAPGT